MNKRTWMRGGIALLAAAAIISIGALGWVDYQLRTFAGQFMDVVDRTQFAQQRERIAIVNVHILSEDGSSMLPARTVLIDDGRITEISQTDTVPPDARVIDGEGRYLVPGFIDTHVHLRHSPNDLLLYIANGTTAIAEMSGETHHLEWRDETLDGAAGPHMYIASRKVGNWGLFDGWFQAWTRKRINIGAPDNAEAVVNAVADEGYDAVKVGTFTDAETYLAVNAAANARGIPVVGHIPLQVELDAVWAAQPDQIAHIEELAKALHREFGTYGISTRDDFIAFVEERADDVAARLRDNDIAVSTSLWLIESITRQQFEGEALMEQIAIAYANPGMVEGTPLSRGWLPGNNPYRIDADTSAKHREGIRNYWDTFAEALRILLRAMNEAGVRIIAGTDAGNSAVVAGFSLHDEMQALVKAGMSPEQSLRAATAVAADWAGYETGRITRGARADLVLLQADPLADIANTHRIETVIVDGRVFDRETLDAMLAAVLEANNASRGSTRVDDNGKLYW